MRDPLAKILEVAGGHPEAAQYALKQLEAIAERVLKNVKTTQELRDYIGAAMPAVKKFVEYVGFKFAINSQPWSGQKVEVSDVKNIQENMAQDALKNLSDKPMNIRLDYAINQQGNYVRGYSESGVVLKSETVDALDKLFNAWLAGKGYLIKSGYLYNANEAAGQEEKDRIKADVVTALMAEGGLEKYMARQGINVTMTKRNYPGSENTVQLKQEAQAAVSKSDTDTEHYIERAEKGAEASGI